MLQHRIEAQAAGGAGPYLVESSLLGLVGPLGVSDKRPSDIHQVDSSFCHDLLGQVGIGDPGATYDRDVDHLLNLLRQVDPVRPWNGHLNKGNR